MNAAEGRRFARVVLGAPEADEPHPSVVAETLAVRRDKRLRGLAKRATYQLRYLIDVAAFEHFLSRAALVALEGENPAAWLEAQARDICQEQALTRDEHARVALRVTVATEAHQ
ncbi:hypothetical protein [Variovorax paradoxus]|uniref:hypothetical protein n=1 Tax=Variovorax paradoxus TaxID=34073 RepID=UPI00278A53E9|nr:hypothetical protein [Variovorax paradoxus]MDQ0591005.1 hypothetical protein [Variovorax paradoxus]